MGFVTREGLFPYSDEYEAAEEPTTPPVNEAPEPQELTGTSVPAPEVSLETPDDSLEDLLAKVQEF